MPQQFSNPANPEIHRLTTAEEIWQDTQGRSTSSSPASAPAAPSPASAKSSNRANPASKPSPSSPPPVLSGGKPGPHKIQGIGAGFVPKILDTKLIDEVIPSPTTTRSPWRAACPRRRPARRHLLRRRSPRNPPGRKARRKRRQADRRHYPQLRRALHLHRALRKPAQRGPATQSRTHRSTGEGLGGRAATGDERSRRQLPAAVTGVYTLSAIRYTLSSCSPPSAKTSAPSWTATPAASSWVDGGPLLSRPPRRLDAPAHRAPVASKIPAHRAPALPMGAPPHRHRNPPRGHHRPSRLH
jgi:hypothetical protein